MITLLYIFLKWGYVEQNRGMGKCMKHFLWGIVAVAGLLLTACSDNVESDEIAFLDVELTVVSEGVELGEAVLFEALVTYGGKTVTDAEEVKFEIWHAENEENREVIEVEHAGDGIYMLEKQFTEEGTYYVYAHVSAEGMHSMPKKEFVIGEPSAATTQENSSSTFMEDDSQDQ